MTRYLGQRDNYKCAPIMIINLIKWSGRHATSQDLDQLCEMMNTSYESGGTEDIATDAALRILPGIKVNKPRYIKSVHPIRRALKRGKAVIISHYYLGKERILGGHIFLCIDTENTDFVVVNADEYQNKTVTNISSKQMSGLLKRKGTKVWIVTKEKKCSRKSKGS